MDLYFSMKGYILCSVWSSCCALFKISRAFSWGTTTTPSMSATIMSVGRTGTPAHTTGTFLPVTRKWFTVVEGTTPRLKTGNCSLEICGVSRTAAVHYGSGKPAILHGSAHQSSQAGVIKAVFERHDINRARRCFVDRIHHALQRF